MTGEVRTPATSGRGCPRRLAAGKNNRRGQGDAQAQGEEDGGGLGLGGVLPWPETKKYSGGRAPLRRAILRAWRRGSRWERRGTKEGVEGFIVVVRGR